MSAEVRKLLDPQAVLQRLEHPQLLEQVGQAGRIEACALRQPCALDISLEFLVLVVAPVDVNFKGLGGLAQHGPCNIQEPFRREIFSKGVQRVAAVDVLDLVRQHPREFVLAGAKLNERLRNEDAASWYRAGIGCRIVDDDEAEGQLLPGRFRGQARAQFFYLVGLVRARQLRVVCEGFIEEDFPGSGFDLCQNAVGDLGACEQFLAEPPGLPCPRAKKPEEPGEILRKIKESGDDKEENQQLDDQGVSFLTRRPGRLSGQAELMV